MRVWLRFDLIRRAFCDSKGNELVDISGRKNRPGRDAFYGGGHVYPVLDLVKIISWQQAGAKLLVLVEGEDTDVAKVIASVVPVSYTEINGEVKEASSSAFKTVAIESALVAKMLESEFGATEGTTLDDNLVPVFPVSSSKTMEVRDGP